MRLRPKSNVKNKIEILNFCLKIVYFELYDVDGDSKISKNDLRNFLKIINLKEESEIEKNSENKADLDEENYIEPLIDIIFKEIVSSSKSNFIDYREFRSLMWHTKIDKSCMIYLEEE